MQLHNGGNPKYPLFGGPPLFYKLPQTQFSQWQERPIGSTLISRVKSGTNPETLRKLSLSQSEQILNFQVLYGWRSPDLENKAHHLPGKSQKCAIPPCGWYRFLSWKDPLHGTTRAVHEILNSTGGTSGGGGRFGVGAS